jgi:hypothetical protein
VVIGGDRASVETDACYGKPVETGCCIGFRTHFNGFGMPAAEFIRREPFGANDASTPIRRIGDRASVETDACYDKPVETGCCIGFRTRFNGFGMPAAEFIRREPFGANDASTPIRRIGDRASVETDACYGKPVETGCCIGFRTRFNGFGMPAAEFIRREPFGVNEER